MTLVEFSAWFEGFTESLSGPPDEKQWERIKARVKEIDNKPVTERIFIDHYYPTYRRWLGEPWYVHSPGPWYTTCETPAGVFMQSAQQQVGSVVFNSTVAMAQLGKAEALQYAPYVGYETLTVSNASPQ